MGICPDKARCKPEETREAFLPGERFTPESRLKNTLTDQPTS